ncbi:hypothetical protein EV368DRAFT_90365 [Lentinula lateritia]|uniref:Uncharacterized protein n=1 Tax=Lentinula aff. lateritia TaxID=2804960 RepID=A0ACC1TL45_9AGAR|nr:hypothetical protein F5876DRAFT_81720 [Lentinula aff. lateritia]KAJ3845640.1 hypothetical protein EV368DRAFT_90365 [Lentinula lateritia]
MNIGRNTIRTIWYGRPPPPPPLPQPSSSYELELDMNWVFILLVTMLVMFKLAKKATGYLDDVNSKLSNTQELIAAVSATRNNFLTDLRVHWNPVLQPYAEKRFIEALEEFDMIVEAKQKQSKAQGVVVNNLE